MSKKNVFSFRHLRLFTLMVLSAIFMMSCADDQDATTTIPDSPGVRSDDPGSKATVNAPGSGKLKNEPRDMHDSTVTRLALREADANQYKYGTQFITRLPNNVDAAQLENLRYGRWYRIDTLPRPFNPRNQERLTNNIYGYLMYHDMVIRYPTGPHTVFLQWFRSGSNVDSVVVWISPAPTMGQDTTTALLSDPPRPKVPPPPLME